MSDQNLRTHLEAIVNAYDRYRARGVLPALDHYQQLLAAIQETRTAPSEVMARILRTD